MNKKLLALLLVLVMVFSLSGAALAGSITEGSLEMKAYGKIVILHTNDVHGAIDSYAKAARMKDELRVTGAKGVLLVDAGDYMQGDLNVNHSQGLDAVRLMNAAGYDVATVGNHEFDYGYDQLMKNLKEAKFPTLVANFKYEGENPFDGNKIITVAGVKIGFFGITTPETAFKAHPAKIKGTSFASGKEMFAIAKAQVADLKAKGADIIVCLGHLGIDEESKGNRSTDLLKAVSGIDLFIDGHSHSVLDGGKVNGAMLVSTGTKFANIGAVVIDPNTHKMASYRMDDLSKIPAKMSVQALASKISSGIKAEYAGAEAKLGITNFVLDGARDPGNRTKETNLGDLITDAMVWGSVKEGFKVDAAVTNGGGIRETIKAGTVTKLNVLAVLPFGNALSIIDVKGADLRAALESASAIAPKAAGSFPQISGMEITINTLASSNRVTIHTIAGKPFNPNAIYKIATNDFMAAGGDNYNVFKAAPRVETGISLEQIVMDYIKTELKGVVDKPYDAPQGRIIVKVAAAEEKPAA